MKPDLIRRQEATAATMAKYRHRVFDWKAKATCLHMARFHLWRLKRKPPPLPQIGSLLAAKKELAKRGWADVGDMLDGIGLKRIPPAAMLLGDIAMLQDDSGLGGLFVNMGNSKVIGWHEDAEGMVVMDALKIEAAWRA